MKTMVISTHRLPVAFPHMHFPQGLSGDFPAISFSSHATTPFSRHLNAMNLSFSIWCGRRFFFVEPTQ
jgi:hypothetical protein